MFGLRFHDLWSASQCRVQCCLEKPGESSARGVGKQFLGWGRIRCSHRFQRFLGRQRLISGCFFLYHLEWILDKVKHFRARESSATSVFSDLCGPMLKLIVGKVGDALVKLGQDFVVLRNH